MRRKFIPLFILTFALVLCGAASAATPYFGTVVPIGGTASDIALDEIHGVLYIADFAGSAVDVMSLANNTITQTYSALPYPGSIALSPDGAYLMATHYGNGITSPQGTNAVSVITLASNARQVFSMPSPPLAVAFLGNGQAIVVTTTAVLAMDPVAGTTTQLTTFANLANQLPVAQATFPGQILQAALATSADGNTVWGVANAGTGTQLIYQFNALSNSVQALTYTSSPATLGRISSSADGTSAMIGYTLLNAGGYIQGRYPNVLSSTNITGVAVDSAHGYIYGQLPNTNQSTGPGSSNLPSMQIMDADNLTIRETITIPEDMVGRAVLNSAGTVLYAVSESGVMVMPVGLLGTYHRVARGQENVFVGTSFCNGGILAQNITITDPGGGHTDFTISSAQAGVTVTPSSGMTPATVQIRVDPTQFSSGGTTVVTLKLGSSTAVNRAAPVRLLVNKPDPSQRGTIINQPGTLSDILPDPARNRFYVLRQDQNQLLVFDASSQSLITTLRTATTPTMMAFSIDQNFLMVGHNDSQLVTVYDLNALAPSTPIVLPGGHYARSIAAANGATLVLARNEADSTGVIDSVDFPNRAASALPSLGVYKNSVSPTGVLVPSPAGANILLASSDGNVMLYTSASNAFVASRKDLSAVSGAVAASDFGAYVVGNTIFDASLVPSGNFPLSASSASGSGFTFAGQGGYFASAVSSSSSGTFQFWPTLQGPPTTNVTMSEAPLLPVTSPPTNGGSAYALTSFTRTVAPLANSGLVVVLSTSGFTVMGSSYPAVPPPSITGVASAADGNTLVAPGEWIAIYGQNLSPVTLSNSSLPLATQLGDACVSANGVPVPLLFVSSGQINAQLPYSVSGTANLTIHTTVGTSANFPLAISAAAPSVFMDGVAGPNTGIATVFRADDGQIVTPTNPIHPKDYVVIYLTGMGTTSPAALEGQPAPLNPLAHTNIQPIVTLGGVPLTVTYAGLTPGEAGVYQINAYVPTGLTEGLSIPLTINQGGAGTTAYVRVVTN